MTAKFPSRKYPNAGAFVADYARLVAAGLMSVRSSEIDRAAAPLKQAIQGDRLIFACGNGGSAAIANHLTNDCSKGIATNTTLRSRVVSLSNTVELITAIAHHIDYAEIFAFQLTKDASTGCGLGAGQRPHHHRDVGLFRRPQCQDGGYQPARRGRELRRRGRPSGPDA